MSKSLTKDCKSCEMFKIDDDSNFICEWGKKKKRKLLRDDGYTIDKCKLNRKKVK
jgi:hypothetical protein